ncbi:hypothetical protein AB0F17_25785 [Nonomuraea sp. NPDC026600]|uniref:hypothetical protein n=1 Tax=Nonomuraea sp. NPDC026600 TaxID=3155363 RepID=UPI0033C34D14
MVSDPVRAQILGHAFRRYSAGRRLDHPEVDRAEVAASLAAAIIAAFTIDPVRLTSVGEPLGRSPVGCQASPGRIRPVS